MSTKTRSTENDIEKRTRRACTESMTVVAHGGGIGMFDVFNADGERYVVDLAGEHGRCTCPDVEYNLEADERCKHARRVRLEFGLAPFEDVPRIRSEYSALTDVELARRRRGIDAEPEPEPGLITVSDAKPTRAVATDGGVVVSGPEPRGESVEDPPAHAARCRNPECEGLSAGDRPLLSFECWAEWAAFDESDYWFDDEGGAA